ncbi:conserved hypothetical protein [Burkholderiales bacterium 8X]|nr:conserved hypothetical protein [Burkholderiales bacterium 8X]
MVGAIADWFAVVALFRHPMGLPIPHTAIIPANKDRIGAKLAGFIVDNFMSTPQVLAKLAQFDPAGRLAEWLSRPDKAQKVGEHLVSAARFGLGAFDDQRVREFIGRMTAAGLERVDVSRLAGQVLDALTADNRHQALLDDLLAQLAAVIEGEEVQAQIAESIGREVKALRYLGLDQVAARLATRRIVSAAARTLAEMAGDPEHAMRQRFDGFMHDFTDTLKHDPDFQRRGEAIRAELLGHPALGDYVHGLWSELLAWLHEDLAKDDSSIRRRIVELAGSLGSRLAADESMRRWINEQIVDAAPRAIERYREDIRRYIVQRVSEWNADEMTLELERNIGRDLQFIRVNGTLVGGMVGLGIHALTQALR